MIGPVKDPVGRTRDGGQLRYSDDRQIVDAGFVLTDELRAELGDSVVRWRHAATRPLRDVPHRRHLHRASGARDRAARPRAAGIRRRRHQFIDMRAAYRLLDAADPRRPGGLRAVHAYNNHGAFPPAFRPRAHSRRWSTWPIRSCGPIRSRASRRCTSISIAPPTSKAARGRGRALLQRCRTTPRRPHPVRAHWQPHDVLIWDNSAVQHKASGDFPVGEPRNFWRYMIEGPVPTAYAHPA